MSCILSLVNVAAPIFAGRYNEDVLQPRYYQSGTRQGFAREYGASALQPRYTDLLWPRTPSGTLGYDFSNIGPIYENAPLIWDWTVSMRAHGTFATKVISGQTVDQNNNPVSGVTVRAFNSTTNLVEDTVVSDASGNYQLHVDTSGNYYVVGFLSGSPDIFGATDNNLTGS